MKWQTWDKITRQDSWERSFFGIIWPDVKRSDLEDEIRQVILSSVEVDGLTAADIPSDAALFGEGVGLDSIDALEIGAALRKKYQVKFKA